MQWSEAEQVPLGCIAPPSHERTPIDPSAGAASPASLCEGGVNAER